MAQEEAPPVSVALRSEGSDSQRAAAITTASKTTRENERPGLRNLGVAFFRSAE